MCFNLDSNRRPYMGSFSIKELEHLSGIKAHTIRIWEKRHKIISPRRTATNIRYYSDDDLKKIINVSLLNSHGVKISKIVTLTEEEINTRVAELEEKQTGAGLFIDQLVLAMVDLEEEQFEKILSRLTIKFGFEGAILDVVYPFLEKIGVLWHTGNISPAQEHFITHLIRQKLLVAIDSLPIPSQLSQRVVLFLPENELHEIGLLFYNYIARQAGYRTYYLGQSVPYKDLKAICEIHKPHLIVTSITSMPKIQGYFNQLCGDFPASKIVASGNAVTKANVTRPPNLVVFDNAKRFKSLISG